MTIPAIGGITSALSGLSTSAASSLTSAVNPGSAISSATSAANAAGNLAAPSGVSGVSAVSDPNSISSIGASSSTGNDFASMLSKGLNAVQSAQSTADGLAVQAATGDLTDIHAYTIAATQASLVTELATAIRTKGVDAFNQIMGMQA